MPGGPLVHEAKIHVPCFEGIIVIDPARFQHDMDSPEVAFESMISSLGENKIVSKDALKIPWGTKEYHFQLSTFYIEDNTPIRFRYRVKGLSSTWQILQGDEILVNFLPAGDFIVEAQARSGFKPWSESAYLSLEVSLPFYRELWFLATVFFLV